MRLLSVEGNRPGVTERLGVGPEACIKRNPKLVYGRMTGWGQDGPMAQAVGHDINYISLAGVLHAMGRIGERPAIPLNLIGEFGGADCCALSGWSARCSKRSDQARAGRRRGDARRRQHADGDVVGFQAAGNVQREARHALLDSGAHFYEVLRN